MTSRQTKFGQIILYRRYVLQTIGHAATQLVVVKAQCRQAGEAAQFGRDRATQLIVAEGQFLH